MSTIEPPSLTRHYLAIFILGVACIVGYGMSKGWIGWGSRQVESDSGATDVGQPTDQAAKIRPIERFRDSKTKSE